MYLQLKANCRFIVFVVASMVLVACGDGGSSSNTSGATKQGDQPVLSETTPFVFVERSIKADNQVQAAFIKQAKSSPPFDITALSTPFQFVPGAKLVLHSSLDVNGIDTDLLTQYFKSSSYDVKDVTASADGKFILFAAHGPSSSATDNTWNIYEYSFETNSIRRIIADNAIANAGQDTNPTYAADGSIIFSSDRSAGNPNSPVDNIVDPDQAATCHKTYGDHYSLLHSMSRDGQNILQLTYGKNHDLKPTRLKNGRIAFVRWSHTYRVLDGCPVNVAGAQSNSSQQTLPTGLNVPRQWTQEQLCASAIQTDQEYLLPENNYTILSIMPDGKDMDQLYKTVTLSGSDDVFLEIGKIVIAEDGKLVSLLKHHYNDVEGGNILKMNSPTATADSTLFGNLAPSTLTSGDVALFPEQHSVNGWYSALWPYYDGTGRLLVSWSQCSTVSNGVNSFCQSATEDGNVDGQYGIWMLDPKTDSRLPIVGARANTVYSDIVISRPASNIDYPFQPYNADFVDNLDTNVVVCEIASSNQSSSYYSSYYSSSSSSLSSYSASSAASVVASSAIYTSTASSSVSSSARSVVSGTPTSSIASSAVNNSAASSTAPSNQSPIANAGPSQSGDLGTSFNLDGSGSSDPDGDTLTYKWMLLSSPASSNLALVNWSSAKPSVIPDLIGDYAFQLVVNDGKVDSLPAKVTITATKANAAPVANAGPDQSVNINEKVTLDGSASSDADGDTLTYVWTVASQPGTSQITLAEAQSARPNFTPIVAGNYVFELVVTDGKKSSPVDSVTIIATTPNRKPVANAGADQAATIGTKLTLDASASNDLDGDALTYKWTIISPANTVAQLSDTKAVMPTMIPKEHGTYIVQLVVNDGKVDSDADTVNLVVGNIKPVANAGADQIGTPGHVLTLDGSRSSDMDGDALTYSWRVISAPALSKAVITNTTAISPLFTPDQLGSYTIELVVNDGKVNSDPDTVIIDTRNTKPVADAGPDQSVKVSDLVVLNGNGSSDADGQKLTYAWSILSKPTDSTTALAKTTDAMPELKIDKAGSYVVQLIVNDGIENSKPDTVVLNTLNNRPIAVAGKAQTVIIGSKVKLDGSGSTDPDGDALTYKWSFTNKPQNSGDILINSESIAPTFTATTEGTYIVQLIVKDGVLDSVPDTVTITVQQPVCNLSSSTERTIPIVVRDFDVSHPDFEKVLAVDYGIVTTKLGTDGLPVYAHAGGKTVTTTGEKNFNQWFRDVAGININIPKTLQMTRASGSTTWGYTNNNFFPIDGLGFGNMPKPSPDHNYHFTIETHLQFDYNGGEVFTFVGDDDLWVYINGNLAIDLGGIHSALTKKISLDEIASQLGIQKGKRYSFDLFFAERHTTKSEFMFQTDINLECVAGSQ